MLIVPFRRGKHLLAISEKLQMRYLVRYLGELGAKTIVEEPRYFDRDYLAEFAGFYSTSARGYVNTCRRLHFFSDDIARASLDEAVAGGSDARIALQKSYLGFAVIRPIPHAPLGRTVLAWYPDDVPANVSVPRVTAARPYSVHLAGVKLEVSGLAWQQQDGAVGTCATIGLWSMLHSAAFDDRHAVPTTLEVTRWAVGGDSAAMRRCQPSTVSTSSRWSRRSDGQV